MALNIVKGKGKDNTNRNCYKGMADEDVAADLAIRDRVVEAYRSMSADGSTVTALGPGSYTNAFLLSEAHKGKVYMPLARGL